MLEVECGDYTTLLTAHRHAGVVRPIRAVVPGKRTVSVASWATALLELLTAAYPEFSPIERRGASMALHDLPVAIGVPNPAATFYPDAVVRVYRDKG